MKVDDDIFRAVSNDDDKASFFLLDSISYQRGNSRVSVRELANDCDAELIVERF